MSIFYTFYQIARYIISGSDKQILEDFTGYPKHRENLPKKPDITSSLRDLSMAGLEGYLE